MPKVCAVGFSRDDKLSGTIRLWNLYWLKTKLRYATLNAMSAPVLPKQMQSSLPKPFKGIKHPDIKVLKPISLVAVFEKIRKG
jgi:hypothetical protein